jgi:orotidine-5'-phosphate decarboxylase
VLSSLTSTHLNEVGWSRDRRDQVQWLTEQGIRAGIEGFVCPPREVAGLKKLAFELGAENICACTPGLVVSPQEKRFDQPDVMTMGEAVMAGSDLLVVGRSILHAASPAQVTREILEQMKVAK